MLKELTAKIQSLCPELMDLSFGCRVIGRRGSIEKYRELVIIANDAADKDWVKSLDSDYYDVYVPDIQEILGHPITLEHCRVAVGRAAEKKNYGLKKTVEGFNSCNILWKDLQPWESQHEVHEFLSQYLLNEKHEK